MTEELTKEWRDRALAKAEECGVLRATLDCLQLAADEVNGEIDRQICEERRRLGDDYSPDQQFDVALSASQIQAMDAAIYKAQDLLRKLGA